MSGCENGIVVSDYHFEKFAYVKDVQAGACKDILKTEFLKHVYKLRNVIPVIQMKFSVTYAT